MDVVAYSQCPSELRDLTRGELVAVAAASESAPVVGEMSRSHPRHVLDAAKRPVSTSMYGQPTADKYIM